MIYATGMLGNVNIILKFVPLCADNNYSSKKDTTILNQECLYYVDQ